MAGRPGQAPVKRRDRDGTQLDIRRVATRVSRVCVWCVAAALVSGSTGAASGSGVTSSCVTWKRAASPPAGDWWHNLSAVSARTANDAWAVGWYTSTPHTLTFGQHWDGREWAAIPVPNPSEPTTWTLARNQLRDVAVVGRTEAWAVGDYLDDETHFNAPFAEHWDGRAWTLVALPRLPSGGYLYSVDGASPDDVWAVGSVVVSKTVKALILHWDGSAWTVAHHPPSAPGSKLRSIDARRPNDVWAVGSSGGEPPLAEHWDGHSWRAVKVRTTGAGANFFAVTALSPGRVWAVGEYYRKGEIEPRALAARWDGRSWRFTRPPNRRWFHNTLVAVDGRAPRDVWVAAEIVSASSAVDSVMYRWNGRRWRRSGTAPLRDGAIWDIEFVGRTDGWAVGWEGEHALTQRFVGC